MLLQNTLDLSTFEIVRFRIWNQTSQPSDRGFGSKYFNTNSGHEAYCREEIFTPIGWRTAAYMDDIDKINEKLDLIFGDELDTDTIIDSWKEVQDFLSGIEDTKTLMTMLDGKLNKTGGEITGSLKVSSDIWGQILTIRALNVGDANILFSNNNGVLGYLGFNNSGIPYIWGADYVARPLLHSGNVGDYALKNYNNQGVVDYNDVFYNGIQYVSGASNNTPIKYGVLMSTSIGDASWQLLGGRINEGLYFRGGGKDNTSWGDWKTIAFTDSNVASADILATTYREDINYSVGTSALKLIATTDGNGPADGFPNNNCSGLSVMTIYTGWQMVTYGGSSVNNPYFRKINGSGSWSEWKTLAFTDSDITGNAATATALKNKVSLWGNSFDGTQSLDGSIRIANDSGVTSLVTSGGVIQMVGITSGNKLYFGTDACLVEGVPTLVHGKNIQFIVGDSLSARTSAMTITEEGNIEIAGANNAYTRKLAVGVGGAHIIATTTGLPSLSTPSIHSLLVGSVHYGLQVGTNTNDEASFIQAQRFNSVAAKTLNLNPLGGAVNVGEGGLNVAGGIKSGDKFILTTTSMNLGSATTPLYLFLVRPDANYIWASANGGYINLGVYDSGPTSSANATLSIYSDRVVSGQRNNAVSLGTSSYRWSNIYSTLGNFSDTVTIGKTGDGAEILRFNIERPWSFYQRATGGNTTLELKPSSIGKNFYISNPDGSVVFDFYCNGDESSIRSNALHQFNGGALIPTGQTLTIGSVTFRETAMGEIEVDGNLHTTGTLASGGKGEVGENTTGNAMVYQYDLASGESVYTVDNVKGSTNVIVQIFEWNSNTSSWDMILTDVSVKADAITVTFGRTTTVNHMVTVC